MAISWANSDGQTGIAEDAYEFAMQHSVKENKSSREELSPQERINQAFGEGPIPEIKDQNDPAAWGMGEDLNNLGTVPEASDADWEKAYGPNRKGGVIDIKNESLIEYLERRFPGSKPFKKSKLQEFIGNGLLMPPPDKPESEWTAKEHVGVMLNTAMAGMGAGFKIPRVTSVTSVKWPEGWGTKAPEGVKFATAEYPHVQRAFKEAVESGATTTPEIIDHMTLNGTPTTTAIIQSLKKRVGISKEASERWSSEQTNLLNQGVAEGKTYTEIAKDLDMSRSAVVGRAWRLRQEKEFERPVKESKMDLRAEQVKEYAKQGLTINETAEKMGISRGYLGVLKSKHNIEFKLDPKASRTYGK